MRVCLDVRSRSGGGLPVYINNLVPRLLEARPDFDFVVVGHRDQPVVESVAESIPVPDVGWAGELLWVQTRLPWILSNRGIDVYHALKHPGPLWCPCASVLSLHEVGQYLARRTNPWLEHAYWRYFQPIALDRADHILANSEWTRDVLVSEVGVPRAKVSTVPYGVDPVFRRAGSSERTTTELPEMPSEYLLAVGNINPKKNFGVIVDAMLELSGRRPSLPPLVIAGGRGFRADDFFTHVRDVGLEDRVITTGFVDHETLAGLYHRAELLVYPSLYEAFGLPPVEAMSAGCRVVASDRGAIREVTGGHAFYVRDPTDSGEMAEAIETALDEPEAERQGRVVEGRAWVGRYEWEKAAKTTATVYESVVNGAEGGRTGD